MVTYHCYPRQWTLSPRVMKMLNGVNSKYGVKIFGQADPCKNKVDHNQMYTQIEPCPEKITLH